MHLFDRCWRPHPVLLVQHHVVHHLLLHVQVLIVHVLMLPQLLRRQLGVIASHMPPSAACAAHHSPGSHHATPHHARPPQIVHGAHSALHRGPVLLQEPLPLLRILGLTDLIHLRAHRIHLFLRLGQFLVKFNGAWRLSRRGFFRRPGIRAGNGRRHGTAQGDARYDCGNNFFHDGESS